MTTPTFNKFKSTTIYGALNNLDYPDNSVQASANFQRGLTCNGLITANGGLITTTASGTTPATTDDSTKFATTAFVKAQSYATTIAPTFAIGINIANFDPFYVNAPLNASIANSAGILYINTLSGGYPIQLNASNLQLSKNNGANYYDVLTTNTGASLSGAIFTGSVVGITPTTSDNSTKFATTAYVKAQNYLTSASLSNYTSLSGTNNWTGVNNFNVNVGGLTKSYATGLTICQNISNGQYETDFIANNGNNGGGFRFYSSTDVTTPLFEVTPSNASSIVGELQIKQRYPTSSVSLKFTTDTGASRGNIFSSVMDDSFHFDLISTYNPNGFVWRIGNTGKVLMTLDLNGKLKTTGSNSVFGVQQIIN